MTPLSLMVLNSLWCSSPVFDLRAEIFPACFRHQTIRHSSSQLSVTASHTARVKFSAASLKVAQIAHLTAVGTKARSLKHYVLIYIIYRSIHYVPIKYSCVCVSKSSGSNLNQCCNCLPDSKIKSCGLQMQEWDGAINKNRKKKLQKKKKKNQEPIREI